ncbi:hypothetical protein QR680_002430 [Steinernema hermaphroditum]|uniref:Uncharacterized protein n=1 Tax=Steinernema hermaphroditum TaxID=289476 RepID=A0AA39LI48_9BILA|nr:hypothetical protein QR680_002430 [Steinernema hermaphroditum]
MRSLLSTNDQPEQLYLVVLLPCIRSQELIEEHVHTQAPVRSDGTALVKAITRRPPSLYPLSRLYRKTVSLGNAEGRSADR